MHDRLASQRLRELARQKPIVLLLGAHHAGKAALACETLPHLPYLNLGEPETFAHFKGSPRAALEERMAGGMILDRALTLPGLFVAMRGALAAQRLGAGRFILLGSAGQDAVRQPLGPLADQVAVMEVDALTALEAVGTHPGADWRRLWLSGSAPEAFRCGERGEHFGHWWRRALDKYLERDLRALRLSVEPDLMRRLMLELAKAHGETLNLMQLADTLNVMIRTVSRYVAVLEQTFVLRQLPAFAAPASKRQIKGAKLTFRDCGLLHHLLGIESHDQLERHPKRDASWQSFVVEDILRRERFANPGGEATCWRTIAGAEIHLLLRRKGRLHAIQVRYSPVLTGYVVNALNGAMADVGADTGCVVDCSNNVPGPLTDRIVQRGFGSMIDWLPG